MISVCLPTHNGSKYIYDQIISILVQLETNDEIIISDDYSTDNTLQIIRDIKDSRIKIFENRKFPSYIFNFENALMKANGDIIFLSDQDDIWLPNKIKKMSKALNDAELVVSDCFVTNYNLDIIHNSYYKVRGTNKSKILGLLGGSPYLGCCMAFNRSVLFKALPFPKKINSHDIWIGNIAAFYFKVNFIDDKLIYYRRHGENISTIAGQSKTSLYEKLFDRLNTIKYLLLRIFR